MKIHHIFAATLVSLALLAPTRAADVRTISAYQGLDRPPGMELTYFGKSVAIDGTNIIVLATHDAGQSALLYQRASGSSKFTYRKTLITFNLPRERMQVRMKNGIAVVHFGERAWIFERSGSTYVLGQAATPLRHPGGVAISGNRILFGGDNCGYDGVVYEKGGDGLWRITGRLDDNQGQCAPEGLAVELYGDTALIHAPSTHEVTTWRRNGTALDWVSAGSFEINAEVAASSSPFALRESTAVTPGSYVFRREGDAWNAEGRLEPMDYGMGVGSAREVRYRDGVLLTTESWLPNFTPGSRGYGAWPHVYLESAPGNFEHVATLGTSGDATDVDVSGRTVVAALQFGSVSQSVAIFALPNPIAAPPRVLAHFDDGDTSDFTVVSGQFALATRGDNRVLAQTSTGGLSVALAEDSDWTYYQRVEAQITPGSGTSDGWVGLVARYADANNYFAAVLRNNGTGTLYRREDGVTNAVANWTHGGGTQRITLLVEDDIVRVFTNGRPTASSNGGRSLPRGRGGLVTFRTTADFDEVHLAAAGETWLVQKRFVPDADVNVMLVGREFRHIGGDWQYLGNPPTYLEGYQQRDASRAAFAYVGASVRNQDIEAAFRIDSSSSANAWVGLLGRYVDQETHYYAIMRNSNRLEIRKKVNGVVTLLGATNYTVTPGAFHMLRFRITEDQLQLYTGDEATGYHLKLTVHDDEIAEGAHGLATYLAATTWHWMYVRNP